MAFAALSRRQFIAAGAAGTLVPRRPDQRSAPTSPGLLPAPVPNRLNIRILVIYGTGETGWFEYSGAPGVGNLPIAYAAPPGVTLDPFGNALPYTHGGVTVARYSGVALQQILVLDPVSGQLLMGAAAPSASYTPGTIGVLSSLPDELILTSPFDVASGRTFTAQYSMISGTAQSSHVFTTGGLAGGAPATPALMEFHGTAALQNATAPASTSGYVEPFASNGLLALVDGLDGATYRAGERWVYGSALPQFISGNVFTAITGLSAPVAAATYEVTAEIFHTENTNAGVPQFEFTGPAASTAQQSLVDVRNENVSGVATVVDGSIATALSSALLGVTQSAIGFQWIARFSATFVFTASGTLSMSARMNTIADSMNLTWAKMSLRRIT